MTDTTEGLRIAEAVCTERCAQMGDPPCSRVSPDQHCDECQGISLCIQGIINDAMAEKDAQIARLELIVGLYRNADAYADTFPDDEVDAKQLRKSETWHRLAARSHIDDPLDDACQQAAKQWMLNLPDVQTALAKARAELENTNDKG